MLNHAVSKHQLVQERVWWFSSMVGKKATLKSTRLLLHQLGVRCLRTTEFVQVQTSPAGSFRVCAEQVVLPAPGV